MALTPEQITIIGLLLAIGAAGLKQLWVFGWTYEAKAKEADFWRDLYLRRERVTEQAIGVAVAARGSDA